MSLCLLAGTFLFTNDAPAPLARVGAEAITRSDVELRRQVGRIYYPDNDSDEAALAQLIRGYLHLAVLTSLGLPADRKAFEQEARRIDAESRAPEKLARIKQVYGADREAYLRTFVAPLYAERRLYHDVYIPAQKNSSRRAAANALLEKALREPERFRELARSAGWSVEIRVISPDAAEVGRSQTEGPSGSRRSDPAASFAALLSRLAAGEVHKQPIEWPEGFQVVRLVAHEGRGLRIESAWIPKEPYDEWFWQRASTIPVSIDDAKLRNRFMNTVSWARRIKM